MKKTRMFLCAALMVVVGMSSTLAYASNDGYNEKITGQVFYAITFTKEEAELYKASIKDTLSRVVESYKEEISLIDDVDKIQYYMDEIAMINDKDVDEMFEAQEDGSYKLKIPHLNSEIIVDGVEYRTDGEGYYVIENEQEIEEITNDIQEVVLSSENNAFATVQMDFEPDSSGNDIELLKSFGEFAEGMANMGDNMDNAEAQVVQVYYNKKNIGDYFGNGEGRSKVVKDKNIVVCNKHDTNTNSITKVQFALQNSDCSTSVKLGVTFPGTYPMSVYCVQESVSNPTGEGNSYCTGRDVMWDGSYKDGHINCSWFSGIRHSEQFHTHRD